MPAWLIDRNAASLHHEFAECRCPAALAESGPGAAENFRHVGLAAHRSGGEGGHRVVCGTWRRWSGRRRVSCPEICAPPDHIDQRTVFMQMRSDRMAQAMEGDAAIVPCSTRPGCKAMTQLCPCACGIIRLASSVEQILRATSTFLANRYPRLPWVKELPRWFTKTGSSGCPPRSSSRALIAATESRRNGPQRSFRLLPRQWIWGPVPRWTPVRGKVISSEARKPDCTATRNRVWSRHPIHVL